jgi:hypothetical protein
LRQDQYLGREIGDVSASGEETEQYERVVIPVGRSRAALSPIGPARDIDAKHVVWGRDPLIADLLCHLGKFPQGRRLTADINKSEGPRRASFAPPLGSVFVRQHCLYLLAAGLHQARYLGRTRRGFTRGERLMASVTT